MKISISKIKNSLLLSVLLLSFAVTSCKKYVDIDRPPSSLSPEEAFADSATATATVLGIYAGMASSRETGGANAINYLTATYGSMSADEGYFLTSGTFDVFKDNKLAAGNDALTYWSGLYTRIGRANYVIERLAATTNISSRLKSQLMGEAKFLRAWFYFQLVNYFGDVPLIVNTKALENGLLPRTATATVYQQIVTDLTEAKELLTTTYPSIERARINKNVTSAFLARVYFYLQNWQAADAEATAVIGSGTYSLVSNLDNVFLNNSNETIWQISLVATTTPATIFGDQFIPAGTTPTFVLYDTLANSFEANDQRKLKWAKAITYSGKTYYYPYKYKLRNATAGNEYPILLRLSEMYLIRSEALAQQENLTGARRDLDSVRKRAGLLPTTATAKADILKALAHERWVELFVETGDRWFNLKRLNKATEALSPIKPSWQSFQQLYPIPRSAMTANPNLRDNEGYF